MRTCLRIIEGAHREHTYATGEKRTVGGRTGAPLGTQLENIGDTPKASWRHTADTLGTHGLGTHWGNARNTLGTHWGHIGHALETPGTQWERTGTHCGHIGDTLGTRDGIK